MAFQFTDCCDDEFSILLLIKMGKYSAGVSLEIVSASSFVVVVCVCVCVCVCVYVRVNECCSYHFPHLQAIGEDLSYVLDKLE